MLSVIAPLQPLVDFFEFVLSDGFHDGLGLSWGLSIVALTVTVRLILLPLMFKQFRSMQAMGRLQPDIRELQKKYKNDKERLQQEMMKLYREKKVNPLASCLPIVAQLPVFLGLFYTLQGPLRNDICPERNPPGTEDPVACGASDVSGFLFIPDLTSKATGWVLVTLILLYVSTQLISSVMSTVSMDRNQRLLMLGLPFFFVAFIWNFPAGLLVYWITTNAWTIVQQYVIKKRLGPMRPPPKPGDPPPENPFNALKEMLGGQKEEDNGLGGEKRPRGRDRVPVGATAAVAGGGGGGAPRPKPARPSGPPPPSPRKKKKRSGRRR